LDQQVSGADHRSWILERAGSVAGPCGSLLAVVGFALPIRRGEGQDDGYGTFLLLLLRGNRANTSHGSGGLGWELAPLLLLLGVAVLAGSLAFSLTTARATARFSRLSLVTCMIGCLILWYVVGAPCCLAAALTGPVAFAALALIAFRNPARSRPWVNGPVPLVGLLAYGSGIALYGANGAAWSLGEAAVSGGLAGITSADGGFWLCSAGWLLASLGGTVLWQAQRQAHSF
jgi:hypothetical protein